MDRPEVRWHIIKNPARQLERPKYAAEFEIIATIG